MLPPSSMPVSPLIVTVDPVDSMSPSTLTLPLVEVTLTACAAVRRPSAMMTSPPSATPSNAMPAEPLASVPLLVML